MARRSKVKKISAIKRDCWKALSEYVQERDRLRNDGKCLICKRNEITLAYHIIPSSAGAASKWNEENIVGACLYCNYSEMRNRAEYVFRHIEIFGFDKVSILRSNSKRKVQLKRHDFEEMTADFRARTEALRKRGPSAKEGLF